jgi:GNAT superfamily N-acetyltransferase
MLDTISPNNKLPIQIIRLTEVSSEALQLLHEYYDAVHVVQRDDPQKLQAILEGRASGWWVAILDGKAVGCVVLRELPSIPHAAECKRLYVQPHSRGHGIADKLMDAIEDYARSQGLQSIYLDSYGDLKTAIALYRKRGYEECERYNDNPQATIFLRKRISGPVSK